MPERLRPPEALSPAARREFLRVVMTEKPTHFTASDLSLLVQYCEACGLAERAIAHLQRDNAAPRWLTIWQAAVKAMKDLAMRLRISPQSRMPHNPSRKPPERLSFYDRMQIEGELDGPERRD
jgi:phage terminase small subunit